jgi:methyl-accepting chemotaxis protein
MVTEKPWMNDRISLVQFYSLNGFAALLFKGMFMKRPSIRTSFIGMFSAIAVLSVGSAAVSLTSVAAINANAGQIGKVWIPKVADAMAILNSVEKLKLAYNKQLVASNIEEMDAETKFQAAIEKGLDDALANYRQASTGSADEALFAALSTEIAAYRELGKKMLEKRDIGRMMEAKLILRGDMASQDEKTEAAVVALVESVKANAESAVLENDVAYNMSFWTMLAVALASIAGAVVASLYSVASIAKPLQSITSYMVRLASGDSASKIPFASRSDEIGAMAGAVEVFRQAAIQKQDLEHHTEANRSRNEAERLANEEIEHARSQAMEKATGGLARALKKLSSGDLSVQIEDHFSVEFEALREDFNQAVVQLSQTLTNVAAASSNIDSGSREIARGSNDLSRRTEQQAASLEQTAAALDQITANVASSSKRSEEARAVATQANVNAGKSGEVVAQAVRAMSRIEESSGKISNIIGVIDEIAFQTNLLALNAGVEAARAGEAGKGFAVVAQEVRELAQRSAQAAKEIKTLIQTSSTEVSNGVKLVSQTGDALKTIEELVISINAHMEAIATSAREQSVGLVEINTAVNHMDQTTQQNAAMVEETNAASNALADEAANLRQLIAQFNLGGPSAQSAALGQMASRMAAPARTSAPRPAPKQALSGNAAVAQEWSEF